MQSGHSKLNAGQVCEELADARSMFLYDPSVHKRNPWDVPFVLLKCEHFKWLFNMRLIGGDSQSGEAEA